MGTLLKPPSGSLKKDVIERVYIPKVPLVLIYIWVFQKIRGTLFWGPYQLAEDADLGSVRSKHLPS